MDQKIEYPKERVIGQPLDIEVTVETDQKKKINFTGVRLNAIRPCDKPLQIEQKEIFCKGIFEVGTYKRKVGIQLSKKIVPSSISRGIKYIVELYTRLPSTDETGRDIELYERGDIDLVEKPDPNQVIETNPIVLSIKGLKLEMQKDMYRPGETIKINFEAKELKEIKALLMQKSNILCNCTQYGRVCTQVPTIPPSAAGAAKTNNPTKGYMLLTVPKSAELTTKHEWEPKEKTTWNDKFGDYNEWYLAFTGKKYDGEQITFDIPIEIREGRIGKEEAEPINFFESTTGEIEQDASKGILLKPKQVSIINMEKIDGTLQITLKNEAPIDFEGCTCKITGIKDMFFETAPYMVGFGNLQANGKITLQDIPVAPGVSEVNMEFESNQGKMGIFKKSI